MSSDESFEQLQGWLERLIRDGVAAVAECPAAYRDNLAPFGVSVAGGSAGLASNFVSLNSGDILAQRLGDRRSKWNIECQAVAASTNTTLVQRAENASIAEVALTADLQVSGKGRRGRHWISPIGYGVAVSVGYEPSLPPQRLMGLSLVVGVSVVTALSARGVRGATLKWPNDVLLGGAKLAGILVEVARTEPLRVVIGVGVNVGNESLAAPEVDQPAANLAAYPGLSRAQLLASLLDTLESDLARFDSDGFPGFRDQWESIHEYQGKSVTLIQGSEEIDGVARGVGLDGQLELATPAGLREFVAGEVSLRPRGVSPR